MTKEERKLYMRKYNSTEKGGNYNRKHIKDWRKKHKGIRHGNRPTQLSAEYRESIIYFLVDRDGWNCCFCGKPVKYEDIGIDHKIPVMLGGVNRMKNLRISHRGCNQKEGNKIRKIIYGH
jgi:5-methylcytosine-specific restriction endonuclease McrA